MPDVTARIDIPTRTIVKVVLVLAVPWLQHFFALKLVGVTMPWIAVGISVVAAAVLEVLWRVVDRRVPA